MGVRYETDRAVGRLRGRIATDPQACTALTCRRGRECFWMRARREAGESRLLIVNHALLAVASGVEGLLPDFDVLVVDEAHRLEGVLLGQLERSVSRNRFEEALRALGTGRRAGAGLLTRLRGYARPLLGDAAAAEDLQALAAGVTACRDVVARLFDRLEPEGPRHAVYGYRARYRTSAELLGGDLHLLEAVLEQCGAIVRALMRAGFVTATYGLKQGLLSVPRIIVGNLIAILAVKRAMALHANGGPSRWDKTRHIFPVEENAA